MKHNASSWNHEICKCDICRVAYNARVANKHKTLYHKRRYIALERLGGVCVHCGTVERLEFDHKDPTTFTRKLSWLFDHASLDHMLEELVKCQLLCKSCHARKTWADRRARLNPEEVGSP